MNTKTATLSILALLLITLTHIGCIENEDTEPDEADDPDYTSMLVDNSGWTTVGYDDKIFSATSGSSFPYQHEYVLGDVSNGKPTFLTYSTLYARGSAVPTPKLLTWNVLEDRSVLPIEGYSIGILDQTHSRETNGGSLPQNLKEHQTTGVVYASKDFPFFYRDKPYAFKTYSQRFGTNLNGSWKEIEVTGVRDNGEVYGWLPAIPGRLIHSKTALDVIPGHVNCYLGNSDLTEISGTTTCVQFATFSSRAEGGENPGIYGCLTGKYWNGLDTIDLVSNSVYLFSELNTNKSRLQCINGNSLAIAQGNDEYHFVLGDFDKIKEVYTLPLNCTIEYFVKGKNSFFIIYKQGSDLKAIEISTSGTVSQLGTLPTQSIGSAVVYKESLTIAYSADGTTYTVEQVTVGGSTPLGTQTLTKPLTGSIYGGASITLASDGELLFAAIKNNLSPKYKGRITQWTGHEIIQYNN